VADFNGILISGMKPERQGKNDGRYLKYPPPEESQYYYAFS
jgi:hypothetical protein